MKGPTQRSLKALRDAGWRCAVVEKWNPAIKRRHDLFGFIDILAIRESKTLAVQTTSTSNTAARYRKIKGECADEFESVRAAGWTVHVHGWSKRKGRWVLKEIEVL
jgi:hypothetical protein